MSPTVKSLTKRRTCLNESELKVLFCGMLVNSETNWGMTLNFMHATRPLMRIARVAMLRVINFMRKDTMKK